MYVYKIQGLPQTGTATNGHPTMPDLSYAVQTGNALASKRSLLQIKLLDIFEPSSAAEVSIVCGTNKHVKNEMLRNTHRPSTVTLAAHARRGLIIYHACQEATELSCN